MLRRLLIFRRLAISCLLALAIIGAAQADVYG